MTDKTSGTTVPPAYFREQYRRTIDPWDYENSAYERDKYVATLAALPRQRYASGLELGCSIGVFTRRLADRCDALLAVDVSREALAVAQRRCADAPHVRFEEFDLTSSFPDAAYDIVTLCELGYYFSADVLAGLAKRIAASLRGTLVLVHWTPLVDGHALTADAVHEAFRGNRAFTPIAGHREPTYRLDVLECV